MSREITVLLVDDDAEWVGLTGKLIERVDPLLTTVSATTTRAALDLLDSHDFDCVVSDYRMAEMDGLAFFEAAREIRPDGPFILITGSGSEAVASDAISRGVTDYLVKIRRADQSAMLANRVRNAVESHRTERALRREREMKDTFRDVLVSSSTRAEIETAFCEQVVGEDRYEFAWIGIPSTNGALVPHARSGGGEGYLDDVDLGDDGETFELEPSASATASGEARIVRDVAEASYGAWQDAALAHGFHSVAAIPLVHREVPYGVFAVYASEPDTFGDHEQRVLGDLAETLAYAIHAAESRAALTADRVTVVELRVDDPEYYPNALSRTAAIRDAGGEIRVDGVLPNADDTVLAFATVTNASAEAVGTVANEHATIRESRPVCETDGGCRVQLVVERPTLASFFADNGADVERITAASGESRAVVNFAPGADVRDVIDRLDGLYPDVQVLSQSTRERTPQTSGELQRLASERLTEKQERAIRAAYLAGYFASPRESSADEVAAILDVSRSTFLEHLRLAQEKVFTALVDD